MIANMHTMTTLHDAAVLKSNTIAFCRLYVALLKHYGANLDQIAIYNPALIPAHAQLSWMLSCVTHMGFMERMHAYKDAVAK